MNVWERKGADKRAAVQGMFDELAPVYDRMNGLITLNFHCHWRQMAIRILKPATGDKVLDLCCGTGAFIGDLRKKVGPSGNVVGIDFSAPMLAEAARHRVEGELILGDACDLPFGSATFDHAIVGWGLRNVADLDLALAEVLRVLRPGGRFVSLEMSQPSSPLVRSVSKRLFGLVPAVGRLFGKGGAYRYLKESSERFLSPQEVSDSFAKAGFGGVGFRPLAFGNLCIHWGEKPSLEPRTEGKQ